MVGEAQTKLRKKVNLLVFDKEPGMDSKEKKASKKQFETETLFQLTREVKAQRKTKEG